MVRAGVDRCMGTLRESKNIFHREVLREVGSSKNTSKDEASDTVDALSYYRDAVEVRVDCGYGSQRYEYLERAR